MLENLGCHKKNSPAVPKLLIRPMVVMYHMVYRTCDLLRTFEKFKYYIFFKSVIRIVLMFRNKGNYVFSVSDIIV